MTFEECVLMCFDTPGFVTEYNRLFGTNLYADARSNLERAIDKAAEYEPKEAELLKFIAFVYDVVWSLGAESEARQ